jgi:hypothetical protein
MDTVTRFDEQKLFFMTGRCDGQGVEAVDTLALRPALLARYRDLARLRYDFPVVLVDRGPSSGEVRSLVSIVDEVLREVAPRGLPGERLRKHALRLEREIRVLAGSGVRGRLSALWGQAAARCASPSDPSAESVLVHLVAKLELDGEVVECDRAMPSRLVEHVWNAMRQRKARAFLTSAERLIVKLSDILRAAFLHSTAGQQPESLCASLGGADRDAFDFAVMSRLISRNVSGNELPIARRRRIEWVLQVLKNQPFHSDPRHAEAGQAAPFTFRFDQCVAAIAAFRERLPQLVQVVKALAIAELEAEGRYEDARHDTFFEHFDEGAVTADDIALFPDYLVCIASGSGDAQENTPLMEMLSAGLPVKVMVEVSDLLEETALGAGHFAFGVRSTRLANTATALGGVFVVQTASSNLYALRDRLSNMFAHRGAALISVYAGAGAPAGELPVYLTSAAAMESRVFPAFAYDPYAGDNQAARFALEDNPQPEADWPVAPLEFADETMQRVIEEVPFTVADFVLCDGRYASHFARIPRAAWNAALIPADEWLARGPEQAGDAVPYVLAVDPQDLLHRVIVDSRLMQIAARVRTFWHRLQEQGGIHNSHAEILLAREKAKWERAKAQEIAQLRAAAIAAPAPIAVSAAAPTAAELAPASASEAVAPSRNPDEAWIETPRCPSCNECQLINDRMFKYNENKQAYIADIGAGTFRQLVEAAEACQVSIIHPGKPRDPGEPGLPELLRRAEAFQ